MHSAQFAGPASPVLFNVRRVWTTCSRPSRLYDIIAAEMTQRLRKETQERPSYHVCVSFLRFCVVLAAIMSCSVDVRAETVGAIYCSRTLCLQYLIEKTALSHGKTVPRTSW